MSLIEVVIPDQDTKRIHRYRERPGFHSLPGDDLCSVLCTNAQWIDIWAVARPMRACMLLRIAFWTCKISTTIIIGVLHNVIHF